MRKIALYFLLGSLVLLPLSGCDSPEERFESHYKRGLQLVEQGDLVKARLEFRNALRINKEHIEGLRALSDVNMRLGNVQRGADLLVNITLHDPKDVESRISLANIMLAGGQLDAAVKFANDAYALDPTDRRVLLVKGAVALRLENRDDARKFAEAILKDSPQDVEALILRAAERLNGQDVKGALDFLNRADKKDEKNVALQLFRIRTLAALKDSEGIGEVLKKLVRHYPANEAMRYALVRWYQGTGDKEAAEQELRTFASQNPENTRVGLALVNYLATEKGAEAAQTQLRTMIAAVKEQFPYQRALAQLMFAADKHEDAYDYLSEIVAEQQDSAEGQQARVLLAQMKASQNQLEEANTIVSKVLAADAKNVNALAIRGSILIANKEYDKAIEDLRVALGEEPEAIQTLQLLARAYELDGSTGLAEEQLAKAVSISRFRPSVALNYVQFLMRYGKAEQAERVLEQVRTVAPSERRVLVLLGRLKLSRRDWLGAQEIAEALGKVDGTKAVADRIMAEVLAGQEKYDESNDMLQASLSDATAGTAPLARYVENLLRAKKSAQAETFLKEVLEGDPDNLRALILLGGVYEVDGKVEAAEKTLKAAMDADQSGVTGLNALARFHIRRQQLEPATEVIRLALERQKDNLGLRMLLANVLERRGEIEAAIDEYDILFEASPQSTVVANNLASLLADYGRDDADIEKAHSIAVRFRGSEIPHFLDTLGWVHYRKGEHEQALTLLRRAADQLGSLALVQYHLGMTYKALGEQGLAREHLTKAIELAEGQDFRQLQDAQAAIEEIDTSDASKD